MTSGVKNKVLLAFETSDFYEIQLRVSKLPYIQNSSITILKGFQLYKYPGVLYFKSKKVFHFNFMDQYSTMRYLSPFKINTKICLNIFFIMVIFLFKNQRSGASSLLANLQFQLFV